MGPVGGGAICPMLCGIGWLLYILEALHRQVCPLGHPGKGTDGHIDTSYLALGSFRPRDRDCGHIKEEDVGSAGLGSWGTSCVLL